MASNENIYFHQLTKLPQQITRCPKAIRHIYPGTNQFNRKSGLTTDDYLRAGWEPSHNMMNVVLRVKQVEFKIVALLDGKRIEVTNLMCTNDSVFNVQITAWGLYARNLSNLQENTICLFSNICVKPYGSIPFGNTGFTLGFGLGSEVRTVIRRKHQMKKA